MTNIDNRDIIETDIKKNGITKTDISQDPETPSKKISENLSATYDSVFRTMVNDCSKLLFPLLNEVFGEAYTGDEEICFLPDEHFLNQQDGKESKRITDSSFMVIGAEKKHYHLECESHTDSSILVRIFEYDAQIALDQAREESPGKLVVSFPHSAVLYLRSNRNTPDTMRITIETPGGEVSYTIPAIKISNYTNDEIFQKQLYFLIPFLIFNYEKHFSEMNENEEKLAILKEEYQEIQRMLEALTQDGTLSAFYKVTIMEMSVRVMNKLLENYDNIREGVKNIMVGPILDYEAKRIWNEGRDKGLDEGRKEGMKEGKNEGIKEGETLMGRLVSILMDQGKQDEVKSAVEDSAVRQALYKKYNLL